MATKLFCAVLLLLGQCLYAAPLPPLVCAAGGPIGSVDLRVAPGRAGNEPLPMRNINRLEEGDVLLYRPILRSGEQRKGEVAMVLVPARKGPDDDKVVILDPKPANQPQSWTVPMRVSVVAYVYGPAGLNRKKVKDFLSRDEELIAQLADYAEKTAQTEALIAALSSPNSSTANVDAALQGFSSKYGLSTQLDRTAPTNQQALLLMRTLTPAMATYDPISPQPSQGVGQTAGLATAVAALFFGSPVGLAAGGTAMLLQLRSIAFPNAEFRSSFAQSMPEDGTRIMRAARPRSAAYESSVCLGLAGSQCGTSAAGHRKGKLHSSRPAFAGTGDRRGSGLEVCGTRTRLGPATGRRQAPSGESTEAGREGIPRLNWARMSGPGATV